MTEQNKTGGQQRLQNANVCDFYNSITRRILFVCG